MKMSCMYCDYGYAIAPSMSILEVLGDPELPTEDYMIWMERFIKTIGLTQYRGILVHCGMKHKGEPAGYTIVFTDEERALIEHDPPRTDTARSPH